LPLLPSLQHAHIHNAVLCCVQYFYLAGKWDWAAMVIVKTRWSSVLQDSLSGVYICKPNARHRVLGWSQRL
jgi:hypothetical protein